MGKASTLKRLRRAGLLKPKEKRHQIEAIAETFSKAMAKGSPLWTSKDLIIPDDWEKPDSGILPDGTVKCLHCRNHVPASDAECRDTEWFYDEKTDSMKGKDNWECKKCIAEILEELEREIS